jgi:hypothetical protein
MTVPNPSLTRTRAWMIETLDKAGQRLAALADAGATVLESTWTDEPSGATVVTKRHGDGCTLTVVFPDGKDTIGPLTFPAGWTDA